MNASFRHSIVHTAELRLSLQLLLTLFFNEHHGPFTIVVLVTMWNYTFESFTTYEYLSFGSIVLAFGLLQSALWTLSQCHEFSLLYPYLRASQSKSEDNSFNLITWRSTCESRS